jgi:hypothetical protein
MSVVSTTVVVADIRPSSWTRIYARHNNNVLDDVFRTSCAFKKYVLVALTFTHIASKLFARVIF